MSFPDCGIYKTAHSLKGKESAVGAGILIYFHNHSSQGPPLVLLPKANVHNHWSFSDKGYLVDTDNAEAFIEGLTPLPSQGLYVTAQPVTLGETELPARLLVQLGYDASARAIVFPARWEENGLVFPPRGFRVDLETLSGAFAPADFQVPGRDTRQEERMLH